MWQDSVLHFLVRSFAYIEHSQGRALNILSCRAPGLAGSGEVHIFFGEIHILLSQNQSSKQWRADSLHLALQPVLCLLGMWDEKITCMCVCVYIYIISKAVGKTTAAFRKFQWGSIKSLLWAKLIQIFSNYCSVWVWKIWICTHWRFPLPSHHRAGTWGKLQGGGVS